MTADALSVVRCLFETIWRLFTSWQIPGTAASPAEFAIFVLFAVLGIRVIKGLFSGLGSKPSVKSGGDSDD